MRKTKITNISQAIIILFLALTLNACTSIKIDPDKPVIGNLPARPEKLSSNINLPLEIDVSAIESLINNTLPSGVIASDSGRVSNTTKFSYQVHRNKPVKFSASGNELIFSVPIDIKANGSYTACLGYWHDGRCCSAPNPFGRCVRGVTETEHGNASPTVSVELRVKLEMQEDYSIKAETYLKGVITGDTHLHIDLIGKLIRININIKDKLEKPLQNFVNDYKQEINNKVTELAKEYNLKEDIEKYWAESHNPIKLGDYWLNLKPEKIIFNNLKASGDKLRIALGVVAKLEIVDTMPTNEGSPLPKLTLNEESDGKFYIYLPAVAKLRNLEKQISRVVTGKIYSKNDVTVKIRDIGIYGAKLNNASALGRLNWLKSFTRKMSLKILTTKSDFMRVSVYL